MIDQLEYDIVIKLKKPLPKGDRILVKYGKHKAQTKIIKGMSMYSLPNNFAEAVGLRIWTSE